MQPELRVCPNCFSDPELKALVGVLGVNGHCVICQSKAVPLTGLSELTDLFQELIDCFTPGDACDSLTTRIQGNWSIFSNRTVAEDILNHILPLLKTDITHGSSAVEFHPEIRENVGYWDKLKDELKWSRRFLTDFDILTEDLGWDEFFGNLYVFTRDDRLYRARVHHLYGRPCYSNAEMLAPEREKARGGRANPFGIPVLYLADSVLTTLYEVKSTYLDEVSVGTFGLRPDVETLKVVDFTKQPSLFRSGQVNKAVKAFLLRERISQELSKPMSRYDTEIEYVPTQFICEFIRVVSGAGGIMFSSSVHPPGKNVVIFDQHLMDCISVELHKVSKLELKSSKIDSIR